MFWIPSLFATEAIPNAMITFVALLMFLQLGEGWGFATLLAGLLTLPWIVRPLFQGVMLRAGHLALQLRIVETAIFAALVWLALSFESSNQRLLNVFTALLSLAVLCSWHEMAARYHYKHLLRRPVQRFYNLPKMFASQTMVILTYGIMIVGVGFLEVFYHNRHSAMTLSWSTAVYVLAGIYLLPLAFNLLAIPGSSKSQYMHHTTDKPYKPNETNRTRTSRLFKLSGYCLALSILLLPQSLMFHARVLFFISARANGGLGASLQWLGLAQGTVGVIAFSLGLVLGYWLIVHGRMAHRHHLILGHERSSHPHAAPSPAERNHISCRALIAATILLPLSPLIYWHLSFLLPTTLLPLCLATFLAQFLFGFGLNACLPYVRAVSGDSYTNATGYLYIPVIALAMLLPASLSGFMLEHISFQTFFAINSLCIIPAWVIGALGMKQAEHTINSLHSKCKTTD